MASVLLRNGKRFEADATRSILDAARAAGLVLEHSCRTGRCGVCKADVSSGATIALRAEEGLSPEDAAAGAILTCCRGVEGDVALDIDDLGRLAELQIKTLPARIAELEGIAPDIVRIVLRTPPAQPFAFLAGQYIDVIAKGVRRSYSLANAPRTDGMLELLVKRYAGGTLSAFWFDEAKVGDLVRLEGPLGSFYLREEGPTHLLFLATGTGIAPVKALIEELGANPARLARHRVSIYWGNRARESFCWEPRVEGAEIAMHRLVSGVDHEGHRRGYVQHAALEDGFDPADTVVYACGSDAMIGSARAAFTAAGLPPARFFSDAFVSSS